MSNEQNEWLADAIAMAEERGFFVSAVQMKMPGYIEIADGNGNTVTLSGFGAKDYLRQLQAIERRKPVLFSDVSVPSSRG